jgi:hypothetical protein
LGPGPRSQGVSGALAPDLNQAASTELKRSPGPASSRPVCERANGAGAPVARKFGVSGAKPPISTRLRALS